LHDLDAHIVDVNRTAVKRYGYTREELLGMTTADIDPDYEEREDGGRFWRQLKDQKQIRFEGRHRRKDGTILPVAVSLSAIELQGTKRILALAADITERREAEQALRESEERFRDLVEHSFDLICTHDLEGQLLSVNPAAAAITGYTADQLVGANLRDHLVPEVRDEFDDYLAEIESEGEASGVMLVNNRRGEQMIWEYHNSLRVEGVPEPIVRGTARDITEQRRAQKELRQQERLATVGQLAAGIAHDFRNILATVILFAQMDLRSPDLPPQVADHLHIIIEESHKATDLVQQILDFSSRAMMKREPLEMGSFVTRTLDVLRRTIPENVRISVDLASAHHATGGESSAAGPALVVLADEGRLQQALTNLALNARDAMPAGGDLRLGVSRVVVETDQRPPVSDMEPGGWVRVTVSDTGEGMTEEVQEHLFEPFFTTKEVGKGTGLGLAQVYGIIRQHGGAIDVETAPGEGTTFRIYLPAYDEGPDEETGQEDEEARRPQARGETLLLVEDSRTLREATRSILESLGYRVLTASDGSEALTIYGAEDGVDLVITDLVMPNMGGKRLMRELTQRAGGDGGSAPVSGPRAVGITGYTVENVADELRASGFVELIQKPFDGDQLAQVVRRALDR
jgi:PAS domain S-box-containing protein